MRLIARLPMTGDVTVPDHVRLSHPMGSTMAKVISHELDDGAHIVTLEIDDPVTIEMLEISDPPHYSMHIPSGHGHQATFDGYCWPTR